MMDPKLENTIGGGEENKMSEIRRQIINDRTN